VLHCRTSVNYVLPFVVNEPVTFKLPVILCLSSNVSPNCVEPDWYITEEDTIDVLNWFAVSVQSIVTSPVTSILPT